MSVSFLPLGFYSSLASHSLSWHGQYPCGQKHRKREFSSAVNAFRKMELAFFFLTKSPFINLKVWIFIIWIDHLSQPAGTSWRGERRNAALSNWLPRQQLQGERAVTPGWGRVCQQSQSPPRQLIQLEGRCEVISRALERLDVTSWGLWGSAVALLCHLRGAPLKGRRVGAASG